MTSFRIPVAMVSSGIALLFAFPAAAQETTQQTTTTTPAPAVAPAPQTSQTTTTTTAPQTVRQEPVGQARTTAAPYAPPAEDRYNERTIEHRPNKTLLSTGTGIFVLSYGSSVIAGAVSDRDADKKLFIPVVGPWMDLGDRGCSATQPCGGNEDVAKAMVITSGVVQGAGLLLALSSLIIPESTTVSDHSTSAKSEVHVLPVSLAGGAGVGAIGRF
jgi:hypothetical protein